MSKIIYSLNKIPNSGLVVDSAYDEWFAISHKGIHVDLRPKKINDSLTLPCPIEDVNEIQFDGILEIYSEATFDPLFLALFPFNDPSSPIIPIQKNQVFSSRNPLRKLCNVFITPYLSSKVNQYRYFTTVKDFSLHVEKVNSMLLLQQGERFTPIPGGYGTGLTDLLTRHKNSENIFRKPFSTTRKATEEDEEEAEGRGKRSEGGESTRTKMDTKNSNKINHCRMTCFHLGEIHLMIKNQVDSVDEFNNPVEIKSMKQPNPRYGISVEYYINLWIQNLFGNTLQSKIGIHDGKGHLLKIMTLSMNEVERAAGKEITSEFKMALFEHLEHFLTWIRDNVPADHQAIISYHTSTNSFEMEILEDGNYSLPIISSTVRQLLKEASVSV